MSEIVDLSLKTHAPERTREEDGDFDSSETSIEDDPESDSITQQSGESSSH